MIQLDTSFLIRALVPGSDEDARLRQWLLEDEELAITAVAWAEFLCGPLADEDLSLAVAILGEALPFAASAASEAAALFAALGRRRGMFVDCLIGAAAIEAKAQLATANPDDFRSMPGLQLA